MTTILLLAGLSSRMGVNKLLLPYNGKTILEHPLAVALRHSGRVVCVLGFEKDKVKKILEPYDVELVFNPGFEKGRKSSTQAGLEGVDDDVAILPGDLPLLQDGDFSKGMALLGQSLACRPEHDGIPGHPVFVAREKINGLRTDPRPFKEFLSELGCPTYPGSYGTVFDVDTPGRYEDLINGKLPVFH